MYPYNLITFPDGSGISLYEIFILIGVIAAIILFRILADRRKMPGKIAKSYLDWRCCLLYCRLSFSSTFSGDL